MLKKFTGIFFVVLSLMMLFIIVFVSYGTFAVSLLFGTGAEILEDQGFIADAPDIIVPMLVGVFGSFISMLFYLLYYLLSGVFLFRFDRVYNMNFIKALNTRNKQCLKIIFFSAISSLMLLCMFSFGMEYEMMLISFIVFIYMLYVYAIPYYQYKKCFPNILNILPEIVNCNKPLSDGLKIRFAYKSYNKVNAIVIPKHLIVVPLNQIKSITCSKQLLNMVVKFNLVNGKSFYIITSRYKEIMKVINDKLY